MKLPNPVLSRASRLYASLGFVSALGLSALVPSISNAAVVYLPPCAICTLNSTPPAGDEWVIQGTLVSVGVDGLSSQGALTNNAKVFSNGFNFETYASFTNNKSLVNTGSLHVIGLTVDVSLNNVGTLTNSGTFQVDAQLVNKANAKIVNNGTFGTAWGPFTNGGSVVNNGSFNVSFTKLTNQAGATFDNRGALVVISDATIDNQGTFRNRAGATLKTSGVQNTGVFINDAGGAIDSGYGFRTLSGGSLINHGTITTTDSVFELAAGSNYDFTGGTLINSNGLGHIVFNRDFTFGEAKAGKVVLEYGGTVNNYATLTVASGYTQASDGDLYNYGVLNNRGTLQSGLLHNLSTANNTGSLDIVEVMTNRTGASFNNTGTLKISTGQAYNYAGATLTNKGLINVASSGQFENDGTLAHTGKLTVAGNFSQLGTLNGTGSIQQDGGQVVIGGSTTVSTYRIQGGATTIQGSGGLNAATVTVGSAGQFNQTDGTAVKVADKLTNNGVYTFSGAGGSIAGNVVNNGEMRVQSSQAAFTGKFTNQGHFGSTGSTSSFKDLTIASSGWITAGADSFSVSGSFLNGSQMSSAWHTDEASLILNGQGLQKLALGGADYGTSRNGYFNNFAWGEVSLGTGGQYLLTDGNATAGGALYVGVFNLQGGLTQLGSINSAFNVYYDASLAGNAYLGGLSYAFGKGGGHLMAVDAVVLPTSHVLGSPVGVAVVPEPSVVYLALSGLMVALWCRRHRGARAGDAQA